ncbi:sigma-70 family RNA polymerase sigma factor [Belliella sp. DSM 111904]|uniref:Sigma-70 family RNA polymerase sigma factor n=1 Tax=Belliella filtrata TaxID=2923435 RepID=A0ABS9V1U1_9BACT|nr:sigma-70 family RNA polymerase sigma factor [Belliella filtrata]MCH7410346.1 sigma-70 family RNA polymerase sigma factor [Belliella filtrata]
MVDREKLKLMTDEAIASEMVKTMDIRCFEELYNRYEKLVFNKCLSFTKSKAVAQDITHDIFLKLFVSIGKFQGKSKFSTWLYSLSYNHCVNYVNRDRDAKMMRHAVDTDELLNLQNPEDDFEIQSMEVERLKSALEKIDPEEKMILLLKYQDDASIGDLEALYEIGTSAVKMRLSRAKSKLLKVYKTIEI